MEASLTCAVCLSLFEEPVTLPVCSHNFCRPCVAECLSQSPAAAPSSSRPVPSRPSDQPAEPRRSPGRASQNGGALAAVSCPLCRKLCPLPRDGGAAALPVNTTLAEVVKLFKAAAKPSRALSPEEASASLAPRLAALGASCEKHPGRSLELYCRMCRRGGCGQCVSEEHRGIFHFVNLVDVVYQEEKLAFFSNLKKLRELQLQLMKETEIYSKDVEAIMKNEEDTIKTEFEKVYKALEARKKQLLEDLESQKKRKIKECLIWKRMKDAHRKTVENILSDCEKLLDECDPHHFLEVACNLNQRMKTQLELMQITSCNKNQAEYKQREMDTTSVINDILALHLSAENLDAIKDSPFGDSEQEDKKSLQNMFCPMTGEAPLVNNNIPVRYMSVSAATEPRSMSHEELRYNYYAKHQMCSGGLPKRASPVKGRSILQPKFQYLKSRTSAVALNETKTQEKVKKQTLLKQGGTETSLPNSFAFTFEGQAMRFDVPHSRNNGSMKEYSLLENCCSFTKATEVPPVHEVILPSDTQLSSALSSDSSQSATPSEGASNLSTSVPVLEYLASPFTTSKESFKKDHLDSSGLFLGKSTESEIRSSIIGHNYSNSAVFLPSNIFAATTTTTTTISNSVLGAAVCEKPAFSALSPSPHNNSGQNICPFFLPVQKTGQESTTVSFSKEDDLECNWLVSSAPAFGKPVIGESDFINNLVCQTSSSASDKMASSEKQPENLSSNNSSSTPHLFAFKGSLKNRCDMPNSFNMPSVENEKSEMKSEDNSVVNISVPWKHAPPFQEFEDTTFHSSSSMDKCLKSDSDSILDSQQNVACGIAATSTLVSNSLTKRERRSFHLLPSGAQCMANSDSDTDDLSQGSSSSDCSSTSEYFSVTEDKILPCLK